MLWHALTLLREFRGDGHVAALLVEGMTGIEAVISHAATGEVSGEALRKTRGWTREQWQESIDALRDRGVLAPGDELELTEAGKAQRQWLEDRTDALALPGYGAIGAEGCTLLGELARPFSRAVVEAGLFPLAARPRG